MEISWQIEHPDCVSYAMILLDTATIAEIAMQFIVRDSTNASLCLYVQNNGSVASLAITHA